MNKQMQYKMKPKTSWLWIHEDFREQKQITSIEIPYRFLMKCLDSQNHNKELSFLYKPSLIPMTNEDSTLRNAFYFLSDAMENKTGLKITSKIAVDSYYQFPEILFYVNTIEAPKIPLLSKILNFFTNKTVTVNVNYTLVIPKTEEEDVCRNAFCLCNQCNPEISTKLEQLGIFEPAPTESYQEQSPNKVKRNFILLDGGKK